MVTKKSINVVESSFVGARTLSKEDSTKNSDKSDDRNSEFSDVNTGHCKPDTGHKEKEIGPGEKFRFGFSVYQFPETFELAAYS